MNNNVSRYKFLPKLMSWNIMFLLLLLCVLSFQSTLWWVLSPHSVFTQCQLFQGTLQLHRLGSSSPIMTSRPRGLPKEDSLPSGNMEYVMSISRVGLHSVCMVWMWRGEQWWSVSFSVFSFRVRNWWLSLFISPDVGRKSDWEWSHSAKGNERL